MGAYSARRHSEAHRFQRMNMEAQSAIRNPQWGLAAGLQHRTHAKNKLSVVTGFTKAYKWRKCMAKRTPPRSEPSDVTTGEQTNPRRSRSAGDPRSTDQATQNPQDIRRD